MAVTVMVTGAGRGIGREIAIEVARYFMLKGKEINIAICSRTESELEATKRQLTELGAKVCSCVCDISQENDLKNFVEESKKAFGCIDVLINNAGISHIGLFQDMKFADISNMMSINLNAAMMLSSLVISDLLKSENNPRIINITSVWGNIGASCEVAYSAAKGGMNAFTKALAKELAPSHIPVNAIACGYIDTEMNGHLSDEEKKELFEEIPAGRPGSPKEIGRTVCLLLEATDYLTGQIITVDGGWT